MGPDLADSGTYYGAIDPPSGSAGGAKSEEWRTPPLWGIRDSGPYLHDGRADTLDEAVALHGGQGEKSAANVLRPEAPRATEAPVLPQLADRAFGSNLGRELVELPGMPALTRHHDARQSAGLGLGGAVGGFPGSSLLGWVQPTDFLEILVGYTHPTIVKQVSPDSL